MYFHCAQSFPFGSFFLYVKIIYQKPTYDVGYSYRLSESACLAITSRIVSVSKSDPQSFFFFLLVFDTLLKCVIRDFHCSD